MQVDNLLIHRIYQDMNEHQAKIALLQLFFASRDGEISREGFIRVVDGNAPESSSVCVHCGKRPGIKYQDRPICVKCWPRVAKAIQL